MAARLREEQIKTPVRRVLAVVGAGLTATALLAAPGIARRGTRRGPG